MEVVEFQDKHEEELKRASQKDKRIQNIQGALENGDKEMKGVALGLVCKWREGCLYYQGKVWIPEEELV